VPVSADDAGSVLSVHIKHTCVVRHTWCGDINTAVGTILQGQPHLSNECDEALSNYGKSHRNSTCRYDPRPAGFNCSCVDFIRGKRCRRTGAVISRLLSPQVCTFASHIFGLLQLLLLVKTVTSSLHSCCKLQSQSATGYRMCHL